MNDLSNRFAWAERLSPRLLKSPWWIGHIPFAFELIGRLRPRTIVELGTYSGSSFAAFCQAAEACGAGAKCYGVDLWEGDIHMGSFDEALFREISEYMSANHRQTAVLVRKDFNAAVNDFADGS
ncbi:MAG: class I SAM-dependent methyltransferase, partial [Burkholderiales bacterium]|nr:class I SAM-dependent methyltransferase [Burkholderiales bacterium]